jgi:nucleosome assembly protein 1-like 1
VSYDRPCLL